MIMSGTRSVPVTYMSYVDVNLQESAADSLG